ncbi:RNA polymerase sigma-70 factor [Parapedobacter sp. 10938]|uniref:RNA polymerase sigma-70 factor n=1 Tax=Parapedobacter flavus TaxID=3110225 RepID=UPI002DBF9908|nr:RNA polymerase sigma-70 factor [Parapedobacter sp. 10938]MEC3878133.1 RNA polymerase sigma-70 factor [Parapedobacter sp. 10938]
MAKYPPIDESALLAQLQEGGDLAFRVVFERFYTRLCVFADRFVHDQEASKDIVNDVFIKFWKAPKKFQHIDHVLASLYLTTKHTALNHQQHVVRSMKRDFAYQAKCDDDDTHYLTEIARTEMLNELHAAIAKLPEKAGKIVRATYLEGKSNQEVADEMGISMQTLRNQKSRALAMLRGRLPKDSFALLMAGIFLINRF